MNYEKIFDLVTKVDDFVWGPAMLVLLVGTGIFLTIRVGFLTWRNLGYAIKSTLSKEARTQKRGDGDVSPFVLRINNRSCSYHRYRQYRGCCNSHGIRRSRRPCLDVDFRLFRSDIQIQ